MFDDLEFKYSLFDIFSKFGIRGLEILLMKTFSNLAGLLLISSWP